jgi:hypothetical protein
MPNQDPIRQYSEANEKFNKAYSKVRQWGEIIADVGRYLNNFPYELTVSNVLGGATIKDLASSRLYTLNADSWPTPKQIAEAITELHHTAENVKSVWASLSIADKSLVNRPDTKEPK